jgi:hypothetical protein
MTIDELVAAISGLNENAKAELSAKLSAGADKQRHQFRTLRAARANPENRTTITMMLATARRLGVTVIEEDKTVDLTSLDLQLRGKDTNDRFLLKAQLGELGML